MHNTRSVSGDSYGVHHQLRLSRFKLAEPPTPRDTEASHAYAVIHDSLGPVYISSLIGISSYGVSAGGQAAHAARQHRSATSRSPGWPEVLQCHEQGG